MFKAGIYCRLSKEDGDKETSDSIENQKTLIENYIKKTDDMILIDYFIDDGFSGLSFDRPGFNSMLKEILKGNINTVITKDMSRLGRDRLETGNFIEKVFPLQKVRYISILDNYDSLTGSNADITPFKGLVDEMYAKDISKKVKGAFDAKRLKGDFIGAFAPYGYKKETGNRNKLIPDYEAARVVKKIFSLFVNGTAKLSIAKILNDEGILCPTEYKNSNGMKYQNSYKLKNTRYWTYSTIAKILKNQMYAGDMVQKKSETIFKTNGKKISHDKNKWIIIENTHEPIINRELFFNVQSLLQTRARKLNFENNVTIYAGLLKCADCGRAMSKTKYKNVVYYKCGSYKGLGKSYCSSHSIREDILNEIVLNAIQNESKKSLTVNDVNKLISILSIDNICENTKEAEKLQLKLNNIGRYKKKSYEDYADGLLSKEEYIALKLEYEAEENEIKKIINSFNDKHINLDEKIAKHKQRVRKFIQYIDIKELTREVIVELVEYIKIYEDKEIEIKFRFESPFL